MLHSIIYYSESKISCNNNELNELAQLSCAKNESHSITGFLTYKNGYFVQYFEGEYSAAQKLFELIKLDERHSIKYYCSKSFEKRNFPNWDMRLITEKAIEELCVEYFLLGQFNLINKKILTLNSSQDLIWQAIKLLTNHQSIHQR